MSFNEIPDIAIKVSNISKVFHVYDRPLDRLKASLLPRLRKLLGLSSRSYSKSFESLKDVSFEIKKGETVGILGRNGAGKSTLLQIICGTLFPTSGSVEVNGRVAALLELGAGFNPEFTGRENIYMSAAILGMSTEEIENRYSSIVDFADIGDFLNQPVKTYSSGMYVRLAFAVNIMSEPDIMIIDEALAVGDMVFQAKCMTALKEIQANGATILFVSHDIGSVKSLCQKAVLLEDGIVRVQGDAVDVAANYERMMREEMNAEHKRHTPRPIASNDSSNPALKNLNKNSKRPFKKSKDFLSRVEHFRYGTGEVKTTEVELLDLNDEAISFVEFNQEVRALVYFEAYKEKEVSINVSVFDDKKINILGCGFLHLGQPYLITKVDGKYLAEFKFKLPLQEGNYSLRVNISSPIVEGESAEFIDFVSDAAVFRVGRFEKSRVWSKVFAFGELDLQELKTKNDS